MDRCAVLVDAGYLYAEGGKLCCGTASRSQSVLQPSLAVELLQAVSMQTTQLPVLRTYWYDAARDGIRTQEQRGTDAEIADLHIVRPRIPRPLDLELLASVEQALNRPLRDDDTTWRAARSAFWGVVDRALKLSTPSD